MPWNRPARWRSAANVTCTSTNSIVTPPAGATQRPTSASTASRPTSSVEPARRSVRRLSIRRCRAQAPCQRGNPRDASELAVVLRHAERLRDRGHLVPDRSLVAVAARDRSRRDAGQRQSRRSHPQNSSFPTMRRRLTRPRSWFSIFIDRLSPTTKNSPGARSTGAMFHAAVRRSVRAGLHD